MLKPLLRSYLLVIGFLCVVGFPDMANGQSGGGTSSDLDTIKGRLHKNLISSASVESSDERVGTLSSRQDPDGSWPAIDYQSRAQSIWPPSSHLGHLEAYARSYSNPSSTYYNSPDLLSRIETTISYWLNLDPEPSSTNWWFYSVDVPKKVGNVLIALQQAPDGISSAMENDLLAWMKKGKPISDFYQEGGANLTDVAQHYIMRACITNDEVLLQETVDAVFASIKIDPESGIQADYSFKSHGPQLYTYGYGSVFAQGVVAIGANVAGTSFAVPAEKMVIFSNFMRKGFMNPVRGQYVDFNVFGRGVSRPGDGKTQAGIVRAASGIDLPEHSDEYSDAVARMSGEKDASYNISPEHYHYWTTDYSLHIRPGYTFGLRMVSDRTVQSESGNGENIKAHFMTEGATYIGVSGDEYYNIFPTWEWNKIPGTTTPEFTTFPSRANWGGNPGKTTFVGGVSDGKYGASVYHMDSYNTRAKKSWFFFDDEIVCLGADINATAAQAINTTVNQSHLTTEVNVSTTGGGATVLPSGVRSYEGGLEWVTQGNVGYLFPSGGTISVSNQTQTGTWREINTSKSGAEVSNEVFKLWFNHGEKPEKASYSYVVLPGKGTAAAMQAYDQERINILVNSDSVQAVLHDTLDVLQVVFYKPSTLKYGDVWLKADKACVVMLSNPGSAEVTVAVADPAQSHSELGLVLKNGALGAPRELVMTLPSGNYAGSTVSGTINNETPEYEPLPLPDLGITAIEDSYVRGGNYSTDNYGTGTALVIKDNPTSYLREVFLKFDLAELPSERDSVLLKLHVRGANTDTGKGVKWKFYKVPNDWEETTITFENKPATTGVLIGEAWGSVSGTYVILNVSGALQGHSEGQLSLHVVADQSSLYPGANPGKTDAAFSSREVVEKERRPQLLVFGLTSLEQVIDSVVVETGAFVDENTPDKKSNSYPADQQSIRDIEVNNSFTPNGDGMNDTWGIPELRYYRGVMIQVFDNGGQRLFYTEDADVRWDGSYEGKKLPTGVYFYVIQIRETGETRRGVLNLINR